MVNRIFWALQAGETIISGDLTKYSGVLFVMILFEKIQFIGILKQFNRMVLKRCKYRLMHLSVFYREPDA